MAEIIASNPKQSVQKKESVDVPLHYSISRSPEEAETAAAVASTVLADTDTTSPTPSVVPSGAPQLTTEKCLRAVVYGTWLLQAKLCDTPYGTLGARDLLTGFVAIPVNLVRLVMRVLAFFAHTKAIATGEARIASLETMGAMAALSDSPIQIGGPLALISARIWLMRAIVGILFFIKSLKSAMSNKETVGPSVMGLMEHTADLGVACHLTQLTKISSQGVGALGFLSAVLSMRR